MLIHTSVKYKGALKVLMHNLKTVPGLNVFNCGKLTADHRVIENLQLFKIYKVTFPSLIYQQILFFPTTRKVFYTQLITTLKYS